MRVRGLRSAGGRLITVSVRHHFSAGHRLPGLAGEGAKCANLHGHTFHVQACFAQRSELAVEFGQAKKVLRGFIDDALDHGYIVGAADDVLLPILLGHQWKHHILPTWPTTEAIAQCIALALLQANLPVIGVTVDEGPSNSAAWMDDEWTA